MYDVAHLIQLLFFLQNEHLLHTHTRTLTRTQIPNTKHQTPNQFFLYIYMYFVHVNNVFFRQSYHTHIHLVWMHRLPFAVLCGDQSLLPIPAKLSSLPPCDSTSTCRQTLLTVGRPHLPLLPSLALQQLPQRLLEMTKISFLFFRRRKRAQAERMAILHPLVILTEGFSRR